ncbi:unnamed protein product [Pseudo-nitzschia multistriata]|uniref:Prolyl 4-hydroxylase alpha subunit Fe(2+) 2OG dioxygenase domain-containing protein n=1 Tax=Pseudo-nitzschia multistriata TaxID=183589 RepID=A0A448Z2Z8_9STRA|nr:unnamed protein product [Pseudo-nitzschia multistriata]
MNYNSSEKSHFFLLALICLLTVLAAAVDFDDVDPSTVIAKASKSRSEQSPVQKDRSVAIYDNVLSNKTADWLHLECVAWSEDAEQRKDKQRQAQHATAADPNKKSNNDDHRYLDPIIEFPLEHPERHSPLQQFLNGLLWQMEERQHQAAPLEPGAAGQTSKRTNKKYYVEYWTRQEWQHILAHQDMDEGLYRQRSHQRWSERQKQPQGEASPNARGDLSSAPSGQHFDDLRHPLFGHVLYLRVGSRVKGPTVVFGAANGGELVEQGVAGSSTMVSVPAWKGRLLRFKGDLLHAVPRPYDVYWTFDQSEQHSIHHPRAEWERSVLLFNLWEHGQGGDDPSQTREQQQLLLVDKILDCGDGQWIPDRTTCAMSENQNKENVAKHTGAAHNADGEQELFSCNDAGDWEEIPVVRKTAFESPQAIKTATATTATTAPDDDDDLFSLLLYFAKWWWNYLLLLLDDSDSKAVEHFSVPLMGDPRRTGIDARVARMQSRKKATRDTNTNPDTHEAKPNHYSPARESMAESYWPTIVEIETDPRYQQHSLVLVPSGEQQKRHRSRNGGDLPEEL